MLVPGEGHPDRWLYEQLRHIERLLCVIALNQPIQNAATPQTKLLGEVIREVAPELASPLQSQ